MTDIPIIFSAPMIRALLDGRKTMTRRLLYTKRTAKGGAIPGSAIELRHHQPPACGLGEYYTLSPWQRVKPGDRLWARESIKADRMENLLTRKRTTNAFVSYYVADDVECLTDDEFNLSWMWEKKSLPSIHMPRVFSRLTLIVTATKIERLQKISEVDARAEGVLYVPGHGEITPADLAEGYSNYLNCRMGFEILWGKLHGPDSWDANPEVVAISFAVHKQNIDALKVAA